MTMLSRRLFLQSVAAAAAAAPVLAQQRPPQQQQQRDMTPLVPPFEPTGWKTVWLDHISYSVSDYRKSTAFYRDLMGWTVRNDNGTNQCSLDINGKGGIIIRNRRAPAEGQPPSLTASASQGTAASNRPPITGVINHVSWGIQPWDTEKVKADLEKRGLNPRPDMVGENFKSWHVTDPDGWDLQISNQTD